MELLSFFVEHHTYHIKNYILHKGNLHIFFALQKLNEFSYRFVEENFGSG